MYALMVSKFANLRDIRIARTIALTWETTKSRDEQLHLELTGSLETTPAFPSHVCIMKYDAGRGGWILSRIKIIPDWTGALDIRTFCEDTNTLLEQGTASRFIENVINAVVSIWGRVRWTADLNKQSTSRPYTFVRHKFRDMPLYEGYSVYEDGRTRWWIRVFDANARDIWHTKPDLRFREYRQFLMSMTIFSVGTATIIVLTVGLTVRGRLKSFRRLMGGITETTRKAQKALSAGRVPKARIGAEEYPRELRENVDSVNALLSEVEHREDARRGMANAIIEQVAIIPTYLSHDEGKGIRRIKYLAREAQEEDWETRAATIAATAKVVEDGLLEVRRQLIQLTLNEGRSEGDLVDVRDVLEVQIEYFRRCAPPGLRFDDTDVEALDCRTRQFGFRRIIANILENAIKYGQTQVRVAAHMCREDQMVEIVVENDGTALPAESENREKLLEWGNRAWLHMREPGNGIGLALAAQWLRADGGEIELAASQLAGTGGARVYIRVKVA